MKIEMKRFAMAALMAGASLPAVCAEFTDETSAGVMLEFVRPANNITLTLNQGDIVHAGQMDAGTTVATLNATSQREAKLGLRWAVQASQEVNDNEVTVHNSEQQDKVMKLSLSLDGLEKTTLNNETYYVALAAGQLNTAVTLSEAQNVAAGTYPVSVQAVVYND